MLIQLVTLLNYLGDTVKFNSIKTNNLETKNKKTNSKKLINKYHFNVPSFLMKHDIKDAKENKTSKNPYP